MAFYKGTIQIAGGINKADLSNYAVLSGSNAISGSNDISVLNVEKLSAANDLQTDATLDGKSLVMTNETGSYNVNYNQLHNSIISPISETLKNFKQFVIVNEAPDDEDMLADTIYAVRAEKPVNQRYQLTAFFYHEPLAFFREFRSAIDTVIHIESPGIYKVKMIAGGAEGSFGYAATKDYPTDGGTGGSGAYLYGTVLLDAGDLSVKVGGVGICYHFSATADTVHGGSTIIQQGDKKLIVTGGSNGGRAPGGTLVNAIGHGGKFVESDQTMTYVKEGAGDGEFGKVLKADDLISSGFTTHNALGDLLNISNGQGGFGEGANHASPGYLYLEYTGQN